MKRVSFLTGGRMASGTLWGSARNDFKRTAIAFSSFCPRT